MLGWLLAFLGRGTQSQKLHGRKERHLEYSHTWEGRRCDTNEVRLHKACATG